MATRALIVDDSKSARTFLARMLEKHGLGVDSAESAEQAIEYLAAHRPDVIFMDHLMPGMDGFQAVQAIKDNPRTATIPIMMYTSQEGELYLSQARALGAVGVLPKQIKPADVSKVLYQLHLIPDRRSSGQSSFRPLPALDEGASLPPPQSHAGPQAGGPAESRSAESQGAQGAERPLTEAGLRAHLADLRRVLIAGLDHQGERVLSELHRPRRESPPAPPATFATIAADAAVRRRARPAPRTWLPWGLAAIAAAVAAGLAVLAWQQSQQRQLLAAEVGQLRETAATTARLLALATSAAPAPPGTPPPASAAFAGAGPAADAAPTPTPTPIIQTVPYGVEPFSGQRLDALRQLFDRLATQGFHGTVDIRLFSGRFCLVGNPTDGYALAPDDTPYARCDTVAAARDDAGAQLPRVPVTVADLIASLRMTTHDAVHVQITTADPGAAAAPYPQITDTLTAGEWNRAASANNRIEIRLRRG